MLQLSRFTVCNNFILLLFWVFIDFYEHTWFSLIKLLKSLILNILWDQEKWWELRTLEVLTLELCCLQQGSFTGAKEWLYSTIMTTECFPASTVMSKWEEAEITLSIACSVIAKPFFYYSSNSLCKLLNFIAKCHIKTDAVQKISDV